MTTAKRPNFFLLLELNPNEQWDQVQYEKALQQKTGQWNHDSAGVTKKALLAQVNRALLPQIHEVMEDPSLRAKEATAARKQLAELYQAEQERFEKQLALLNMKEIAEADEIDKFVAEFKHIKPPTEIEKLITVKKHSVDKPALQTHQTLDASMANNIADRLEILHMKSLYELLQCSRDASNVTLSRAAEELYAQIVRLHPNAETTIMIELVGFAASLFKSEEMRVRYDETLRQAALQQILQDLDDSTKRSTVKELHPKQVLFYLESASKAGWLEDEALAQLKAHARLRRWFVTLPAGEKSALPSVQNTSNAEEVPQPQSNAEEVPQPQSNVENVRQLQYQILRAAIRLYWKWPENCLTVCISYSIKTDSVQHHTDSVTTHYVSRTEYDRLGYYEISGIWNQRYDILVSSVFDRDGIQAVASGVRINIHLYRTVLTYEIQLPHLLYRRRTLRIMADTASPIPTLLLISKAQSIPLHKSDGEIFYRLAGRTNERGEMSVKLPGTLVPPGTFGKLFLEDDRLYETIIIHHPAENQLRLS